MRRRAAAMLVLAISGVPAGPALGSGDPGPTTVFVNRRGGTDAERDRLYRGRMGVVFTDASDGMLYLDWRLLNGLDVGSEIGATLNTSCCDPASAPGTGVAGWSEATALVPGIPQAPSWMTTDLPGPDYTSIPNCFDDAFDNAAATLRDRAARYGASNPAVAAWLTAQNAVFDACGNPDAVLPPAMAGAPKWLVADRAYQEAAFALYKRQYLEAYQDFQAIHRDTASPWQPRALYLSARTLYRTALTYPGKETFAAARMAIGQLQAQPGAYGQSEVHGMLRALAYRDQPETLFGDLDRELAAKQPVPDIARSLRDYITLSGRYTPRPEIADWIATLHAMQRDAARAHATERWTATRKPVWLVAALALTSPGDPQANGLAVDAAAIPRESPAWLTAQYHEMRLTFASADPATLRHRIDAILAGDLAGSERNLFLGLRTQLATSLPDMMRHALRQPYCAYDPSYCGDTNWLRADGTLAQAGNGRVVALGPDAKAILDRLPLAARMEAGAGLPQPIRLDIALTNYGRAVQLQDDRAIDRLAGELAELLPQIRGDWLRIRSTAPGPAKRFAEFFVLAKIPGVAPDMPDYTRPQGSVASWQGSWWDWLIVPPGKAPPAEAPAAARYDDWDYWAVASSGETADLTCYGYCGAGAFPLRLPDFVGAQQFRAQAERGHFVFHSDEAGIVPPPGAVPAWQELLDYARAHPRDPRAPEALYWLIRITRFGHAHGRIGYQAFRLLHGRYAGSAWMRRSPYYFD